VCCGSRLSSVTKGIQRGKSKSALIALAVVMLAVYFAFTPFLAALIAKKSERYYEERPYLKVMFEPAGFLYKHVGPYRSYADWLLRNYGPYEH